MTRSSATDAKLSELAVVVDEIEMLAATLAGKYERRAELFRVLHAGGMSQSEIGRRARVSSQAVRFALGHNRKDSGG